jgi:hypothetical protein
MAEGKNLQMLGLAILAASEVPNFLAGMLPSLMTIQRFGAEEEDLRSLRRGEAIGSVLALGVGFGATLVADSPWPFLATVVVLLIMLGAYEHAIRNPHPDVVPINRQP